ncbi:C39 family peptidase [Candidatus Berkelbacteria bacterium]|nr:C39 family peptidase [Candidatus Berkelbacteria bacterium]
MADEEPDELDTPEDGEGVEPERSGGSGVGDLVRDRAGKAVTDKAKQAVTGKGAQLAAKGLGGKVAGGLIGGPIGTAIAVGTTILENKTVRRVALGGLTLWFTLLLGVAVLAAVIVFPFLNGDSGKYPLDAMAATNQDDMHMVRFLKCLDELTDDATVLTQNCLEAGNKAIADAEARSKRLRAAYAELKESDDKKAFAEALDAYDTALKGLKDNLRNVKELRKQKVPFLKASQQLDTITAKLGLQLGVSLDVPNINQPEGGWCGYTSVAMVAQYFVNKAATTGEVIPYEVYPTQAHHTAKLNEQLGKLHSVYPGLKYSEYLTHPKSDANFFPTILKSLAKGAPVIFYSSFYADDNGGYGHVIVLTGYDPEKKLFVANNPLPGGSQKAVTNIDDVDLTVEGLTSHADYYLGPGFLYYAGDEDFR